MPVKGSSSLPALNLQVVEHLFFISEGQASHHDAKSFCCC